MLFGNKFICQPLSSHHKPVAEPVVQPVAEPVVQPVAEPDARPVAEPVAQPVAEPVAEPVAKPVFVSLSNLLIYVFRKYPGI
jgi:hypothetical protein